MEKKISIILVNYNGARFQNDCIRSIKKLAYSNYEIIVVDNNSSDDSVELLQKEFDDVILIRESANHGWAGGNNIGIKYAIENGTEHILILNNDTEISPNMLKNMMRYAKEKQITVPKIYYYEPSNLIWYAGGKIAWNKGIAVHEGMGRIDENQFDRTKRVEFATGCCILVHKSVFQDIGMFDENYFLYCDDTDFCARVNEAGFKIVYVPDAVMWHKVSSSTGGAESKLSVYYNNRNRLYFINKFKNKCNLITYTYTFSSRMIRLIVAFFSKSNDKMIPKAFIDYYFKHMGYQKL